MYFKVSDEEDNLDATFRTTFLVNECSDACKASYQLISKEMGEI